MKAQVAAVPAVDGTTLARKTNQTSFSTLSRNKLENPSGLEWRRRGGRRECGGSNARRNFFFSAVENLRHHTSYHQHSTA